jgi:hypothetical protein
LETPRATAASATLSAKRSTLMKAPPLRPASVEAGKVSASRTPASQRAQKVPELVHWLVPPLVPEWTVRAAR